MSDDGRVGLRKLKHGQWQVTLVLLVDAKEQKTCCEFDAFDPAWNSAAALALFHNVPMRMSISAIDAVDERLAFLRSLT